jgi:hypothetical protein
LTTCAHSERTQPLAPLGEPHRARRRWLRSPAAACEMLQNRSSATSNPWPWESAEAPDLDPHEPVGVSPTAADTSDPYSAAIPGQRCFHRIPVTGFRKNRWLPPVLPQVTAGHSKAPHLRACSPDGPRSDRDRSRAPRACTLRACASVDRIHPPVLLGTSSRQAHLIRVLQTDRADVAADATSSLDPRFVAFTEPRCRLDRVPPNRSKLRSGVADANCKSSRSPSQPKSRLRPKRPVPEHPRRDVATAQLHNTRADPGPEIHRAGEPARRAPRPM